MRRHARRRSVTIHRWRQQVNTLQRDNQAILSGLSSERAREQADIAAEQQQEQSDISTLNGKLAGLTVPSDPLASYNLVCDTTATNSQTGVTNLYYYPCTNSIVPAPGG